MEVKNVHSLTDFIKSYRQDFPEPTAGKNYYSDLLFRGQGDAENFELETTLERYTEKQFSFYDYLQRLDLCHDELSVFTGRRWYKRQEAPHIRNPQDIFKRWELLEFMIYLRHYGFPSPLLDWSVSPYIAAFFAYSNRVGNADVAIYAFMEKAGRGKSGWVGEPEIHTFGARSIGADKRHHTQQARYTICYRKKDDHYIFSNHEEALVESDLKQDFLIKYVLPGNETDEMLERLNLMNINAYTLFHNEEGLAQHLAFKNLKQLDL